MVHEELSWVLAFEVEETRSPIKGCSQEGLARTDDVSAAQAVVGYGLDPLGSSGPSDSPALCISVRDAARRRIQLAECAALAIGAGQHASDELVVEVRLEHTRHPWRGAENRSHCCLRFCEDCRIGRTAVDTS